MYRNEHHKQYHEQYRKEHKEKMNNYQKNYYQEHKEEIDKRHSDYYYNNKEQCIKRSMKNSKILRKTNSQFKIKDNLRRRLNKALQKNFKTGHTIDLLGCSIEQLKDHLQNQFRPGMAWQNYGKWHIDHIRPCASFDLTKEEEQRKCFHYSNLQPLWAKENISKKDKTIEDYRISKRCGIIEVEEQKMRGGEKMLVKILDENGHSELEVMDIADLKAKVDLKDKFIFADGKYINQVTLDGITELPREIVVTDSLIGG